MSHHSNDLGSHSAASTAGPFVEVEQVSTTVEIAGSGYRLTVPSTDNIGEIIRQSKQPYERDLLRTTLLLLRSGDRVVDVGANIGNHTIFWAANGLSVDAFEPNPAACLFIDRNVAQNGLDRRVVVHRCGLGSTARTANIVVPDPANLGSATVIDRADRESHAIEIRRLDDVLTDRLRPVRLMKVDTEGFEEEVLRGAVEILKEKPVLIVEEHSRRVRREVGRFLRAFGYVRIPVSLAYSPTFLHVARWQDALRLATAPRFWKAALTRLAKNLAHAVLRPLRQGRSQAV